MVELEQQFKSFKVEYLTRIEGKRLQPRIRESRKKYKFTSKNWLERGELEKTMVTSNLTRKPVVWVNYQNLVPYFLLVIDIYGTNQSFK